MHVNENWQQEMDVSWVFSVGLGWKWKKKK